MLREMQCEVRAMSDLREGGRPSKVSDTLPKQGRVNEVCKEWLVHEDGALAYKLQQKEVQEYYTGNKSRNAIVREDFPRARDEQKREEEEAISKYHQMVQQQEERDAKYAKDIAQRIQREEEEQRRMLEVQDQSIASKIQEKEIKKVREAKICHLSPLQGAVPVGDINSVGLPLPFEDVSHNLRSLNLNKQEPVFDLEQEEEHQRLLQEQRDEELARRLQEQEEELDSYDMLDRDRQLAIEAQDKELAKLLQDRERAKAKRARERARQRALLKKQQQQHQQQELDIEVDSSRDCEPDSDHRSSRPSSLDINRPHKPRLPDPEEIEVIGPPVGPIVGTALPNIAMAIDPTYTPSCSTSTNNSPAVCLPPPPNDLEDDDTSPVPPYMPIQGQRRTASLEKKQKKNKVKDGCKQQ